MSRVLVTGASGFIGRYTCAAFASRGYTVRAALRQPQSSSASETIIIGEIGSHTDWSAALVNVDAIIHLAARVHVMRETATDPLTAFREINTAGTIRLAQAARDAGIKRFVFVSTIGVNGEETPKDQPINEASPPAPHSPYTISKWEAEQALRQIDDLETVVVRPPLVYGLDAPGNFAQLVRFGRRGLPLPFGWTTNRRSLIAVQNLADFLITCVEHPRAAGETFLISDGDDLSTTELLRRVGIAIGKSPLLIPFPPSLLRAGLIALGREKMASQLLGSLVIDSGKARDLLNWKAPLSMEQALRGFLIDQKE
jgi:nucleoside-diphosphate-sugar epimerase